MRNIAAVLFLALAACGGGSDTPADSAPPTPDTPPPIDTPPPPDTQVLDLTCMANQTAPTTATATVTISGKANSLDFDIATFTPVVTPLDEADIDVCTDDCADNGELLDSSSSATAPCDQDGCAYTTTALDTNDAPLDAYIKVSKGKGEFRTSSIVPSEPTRADLTNVPALVLTPGAFSGAALLAQAQQNDLVNGALAVAVTDCGLQPVQGATLILTQGGNPIAGTTVFDPSSFAEQLAGTFIVFNVPAGEVSVNAMVNGTTFRAHTVQVFAGETTGTQITPGFAAP